MPLTSKGQEIKSAMTKEYGEKKGESVFYASRNSGRISGVDSRGDMSEGGWSELKKLLAKWINEESKESEHKSDALQPSAYAGESRALKLRTMANMMNRVDKFFDR